MLLEIGAEGAPMASNPFGRCMTLLGARLREGKAVVQLAESVRTGLASARVHEFAFADGKMEELPAVLGYCEASALAVSSVAVALTPDEAGKTVAGAGRAYFHTAPADECKTARVFLVPGDRVSASRETDAFVEITYRNPKSGQVFRGWLRRDRLLDPAR